MNIHVQFFEWMCVFISVEYTLRSEIAGPHGVSYVLTFCWNRQTVFQSSYARLRFHLPCKRFPISPHPHQHLLLSISITVAILLGVKWHLIVVFIFMSLLANDEHCYLLSYGYWPFVYCLCRNVKILCSILNWRIYLFCYWVVRVLCLLWLLGLGITWF